MIICRRFGLVPEAGSIHMSTITVTAAFQQASTFFRAGMLDRAETLCRTIIRAKPDDFDTLHLLAIIQAQLGQAEDALASYDKALAVK